jgi:hypothetical protein
MRLVVLAFEVNMQTTVYICNGTTAVPLKTFETVSLAMAFIDDMLDFFNTAGINDCYCYIGGNEFEITC